VLSNFVIGLREGIEASLVIGVLIAYLVKIDRRTSISRIWRGVVLAVVASMLAAAVISIAAMELPASFEPAFAGFMSVAAVGLVTWMVLWMRTAARTISGDLRKNVDTALIGGASLTLVAFVAVSREGLESALFLWAASNTSKGSAISLTLAALAGFAVAAAIGYAMFKGSVRLKLSSFFKFTGIALILLAAGVAATAVHEFEVLSWLPATPQAFDVSSVLSDGSLAHALVSGITGLQPTMTWLQVVVYCTYAVSIISMFLRPVASQPTTEKVPA